MGIVVGIDIGGSTTKIAGFREEKMLIPMQSHRYLVPSESFCMIMDWN